MSEHSEEYYLTPGKDVYSAQSIMASIGVQQEDTVYKHSANDFVRWPFTASLFFETAASGGETVDGNTVVPLTEAEQQTVEKISAEIKAYKDAGETIAHQERIKELRQQKKAVLAAAEQRAGKAKQVLIYKKLLELYDSQMVSSELPQFKKVHWPYKEQMPYFTAGLADFAAAIARGEPTAITGGPCFFSEHEVDMIFTLKDGSQKIYDFTTGRRSADDGVSRESDFAEQYADLVVDIAFKSDKTHLTTEQYDSILYLFELAEATGSVLTIPIVDASYEKYLTALFAALPADLQKRAHERYRVVAHSIIGLYRDLFDFFKTKYPSVRCVMMTGEDTELLETYYEKRTPYVEKPSVKRGISSIPEKFESVKDYITLPALPFYLLGVQHVLEVDYLGEADSFRKCRSMHKGDMQLSALLYPIKISADGWRNIFQTDLAHKEYVARSEYGCR